MSLATELSDFLDSFHKNAPPKISETILDAANRFRDTYQPSTAVQPGEQMPDFRMTDATGKEVSRDDLLARGPLLIIFYRGEWCPYCNIELRAYQKHLADFKTKGVTLVAISPELPNQSLTTTEKNNLEFPVLSDVNNVLARQLGIIFPQPQSMNLVFDAFNVDMAARNGNDTLEVPVPASYLVDQKGVIRNAFIDPDYTKRLEPATALEWIDALSR